jgi:hypothetical protein
MTPLQGVVRNERLVVVIRRRRGGHGWRGKARSAARSSPGRRIANLQPTHFGVDASRAARRLAHGERFLQALCQRRLQRQALDSMIMKAAPQQAPAAWPSRGRVAPPPAAERQFSSLPWPIVWVAGMAALTFVKRNS